MIDAGEVAALDSRELEEVAQSLTRIAEKLARRPAKPSSPTASVPADVLGRAEQLYRARRQRVKHFDERLFGEPAWDLLLDLFIQGERGKQVSISSACLGAAVPPTTALRWIDCLVGDRLLMRATDPQDGRRVFLRLTSDGRQKMLQFLENEL